MKKALALILTALLVLSACGGNAGGTDGGTASNPPAADAGDVAQGDQASSSGGVAVTAPGQLPIVNEPVTLTIMTHQHSNVEDYETNKMTLFMEEQTGVNIEWMLVPEADAIQKVNLILASQVDLPDVFMIPPGITNDIIADMADQKIFIPLDDMIENLGYWYKERRAQDPLLEEIMKLPDGHEYSLPKVVLSEPNATSRRMWINQNWLTALNLNIPTTTDELTNVLRAFKNDDPNGNGINDEIAFMGSTNGWNTQPEWFILNSFTEKFDRDGPWYIKDGKFETVLDDDGYRKGLIYMNMLVNEGLLDPASFTQEDEQLKQLFNNEEIALVGMAPGGGTFLWAPMDGERVREYVPLAPLKGPDGYQNAWYSPYNSYYAREYIITSACENPEVAFRFADFMYSREASMRNRLGEPGVDYLIPEEGVMGVDGDPATYIPVLAWGSVNNGHWQEIGPTYNDFDNNGVKGDDPYELQQYLWESTKNFYTPYIPDPSIHVNSNMFHTVDDARALADIWSTLRDFSRASLAEFITGVRDPNDDGAWNQYLDEFKSIGIDEYLAISQRRVDSME
jgi:putative aldouronate transport system substrate-binding protein